VKTTERKTRSRLLRQVLGILEKARGRRRRRRRPDALETLLHSVLAGNGNDLLAAKILEKLHLELVDWNELRVTTPRDIEEMIAPLPDAAEKALILRRILHKLFRERHSLSLGHFKRFGQERLSQDLDELGGLNPAMRDRILLKAFDVNVLPLTEDIERVTKRLGLIESYLTSDKVKEAIEEILPPKRVYSFYHLMSEHAETVCSARNYVCATCILASVCVRSKSGEPKREARTPKQGDQP
jgi:endonuclease III